MKIKFNPKLTPVKKATAAVKLASLLIEKVKAKKAKKVVPGPINPDRASIVKLRNKLAVHVAKFLKAQTKVIAAKVHADINKADDDSDDWDLDWDDLVDGVSVILGDVVTDGIAAALKEVGSPKYPSERAASSWAASRGAEMVGRKWIDGVLVDNPDARWVITDSTREMIRAFTADAVNQGYTMKELADQLSESFAFSESRAMMIARTETRYADSSGQILGYVNSGVVAGVEWTTAEDDKVSEECVLNGDAGMIPLGGVFPSGVDAPPQHPNCRCVVIAVLKPEQE